MVCVEVKKENFKPLIKSLATNRPSFDTESICTFQRCCCLWGVSVCVCFSRKCNHLLSVPILQ